MIEDPELLRRYANGSQDAFTELVRRRVDLVYAVALRHVGGDAHLAEDVTQRVFTDLARKAQALSQRAVLTGWLYRSAQFAASDVVRSERRRRTREQESVIMHEASQVPVGATADWHEMQPVVDEALAGLPEADRDALALRFFENKRFAEIGATLRMTEDAARKRVDRALDKMACALSRRGVKSTAGALGLALGHQLTGAAPASLAGNVASKVLASGVAAGGAGLAVFGGATVVKLALAAAGAIAAGAVGTAVYQTQISHAREAELRQLQASLAASQTTVVTLRERVQQLERYAADTEMEAGRLLALAQAASGGRTEARSDEAGKPMTDEEFLARLQQARTLARAGRNAEALAEFLRCFDDGMNPANGRVSPRASGVVFELARFGEKFPPALEALRQRRDAAEKKVRENTPDMNQYLVMASINQRLGEATKTLALYDELAADGAQGGRAHDQRKFRLGLLAVDMLVEARRYEEAGKYVSFASMVSNFESRRLSGGNSRLSELDLKRVGRDLEILAGIRADQNLEDLAGRVIKSDNLAETKALLRRHILRAERSELLERLGL